MFELLDYATLNTRRLLLIMEYLAWSLWTCHLACMRSNIDKITFNVFTLASCHLRLDGLYCY